MYKYFVVLFALVFGFRFTFSQNSKRLDSLLKAAQSQEKIELISTLNEISWEFKNVNIDSAFHYARKSVRASKRLDNKKAIASSYNSLANCFDGNGSLDSAQFYHEKSLDLKLEIGHSVGAADSYNNLGIVYDLMGDFEKSLQHYFKALEIYEEEEGVSFDKVPMVLGNIGIVYKKQKEYDKVLTYYKQALKIYEDNNYDFGIVVTKGNIGSVFLNTKDFEESIKYSLEAKELYAKLGYTRYVPYMLSNIAIARDSLKQFAQSQKDFTQAIRMHEEYQNYYESTYAQLGLAKSYNKQKRYLEASKEAQKALAIIQEKSFKEWEIEAFKVIADAASGLGNYKSAFNYFELYAVGKDSLFEENKTQTIFELETKYQTEKKEKEILSQRADLTEKELDLSKKNIQILGLVVLVVVALILGYFLYNQQKLKNKQLQKENELKNALTKIETQNKLQEQRLRISRDLHDNIGAQLTFIISSVDNLKYGFEIVNDNLNSKLGNISEFARETIYELRDTIWAMNKSEITLDDLQTRISNFIDKANVASKGITFSFNNQITSPVVFTSVEGMNIYRIIQEGINNAIKYANAQHISVNINEVDTRLNIEVIDDGDGFDLTNTEFGNGINNMKKRADEIEIEFNIQSANNLGTSITLFKPL